MRVEMDALRRPKIRTQRETMRVGIDALRSPKIRTRRGTGRHAASEVEAVPAPAASPISVAAAAARADRETPASATHRQVTAAPVGLAGLAVEMAAPLPARAATAVRAALAAPGYRWYRWFSHQ
jgi:hypothetical protein